MTIVSRMRSLALSLLLLLPASLAAQQLQLTLDPSRTTVDWTLGDILHTVHGTFKLKSGTVLFDPHTGNAGGEILVDTTSAESGNSSRDAKMHKDVLESKRYPEITFIPKHVVGKFEDRGASHVQVQGTFHIHGGDHDMTLAMAVQASGSDVTATSDFNVPYQDWGMKNPSTLFLKVDNYVQIKVAAAGKLTSASGTATGK